MTTFNPLFEAFEKHTDRTEVNQVLQKATRKEKVKKLLKNYGITSIWHFTDKSNVESIMEHGILSLKKLETLKIDVEYTGASADSHNIDHYRGLDKYVHLAFINDHPLYYVALKEKRVLEPVWIEIDISVIFEEQTLFCDRVANDNSAKQFTIDQIEKRINFDTMVNNKIFDKYKEARKAEILVLNNIEPEKILGVY